MFVPNKYDVRESYVLCIIIRIKLLTVQGTGFDCWKLEVGSENTLLIRS